MLTAPATFEDLSEAARDALRGAIDLHVHAGPDPFAERKLDARGLVDDYASAGLAGFVLKSHEYPTQPLAWALNEEFEGSRGIHVTGALALDHAVGGLNPDALEVALRLGTRVIWGPTFDTAWSRERFGRWNSKTPALTLLDAGGGLVDVFEVLLDLIAEHDATLCTGHASPDETLALVRAARGRSIRTVVTHATSFFIPLKVQQACADLGALVEQCGNPIYRDRGEAIRDLMLHEVRELGPEHVVLSTDLGQATNPLPSIGYGYWLQQFLEGGFTAEEVRRKVQENPRAALGI
jgi:hypothetical protein